MIQPNETMMEQPALVMLIVAAAFALGWMMRSLAGWLAEKERRRR